MNDSLVTFGQMQAAYRAAAEIMKHKEKTDHVEIIEFCCGQENAEFNLQMIDLVRRIVTFTETTHDIRKI